MTEFLPIVPASPEVNGHARYEAAKEASENGRAGYETMFARFKEGVRQKLGDAAKKLLGGWDGREYLEAHDDNYDDALLYIANTIGNPSSPDEFERRLAAHTRDIEENRRIPYDFGMRMPAVAYRQGGYDEKTGKFAPRITRAQAERLYWYQEGVEKPYPRVAKQEET